MNSSDRTEKEILEKPTEEHQQEFITYVGTFEELKEIEKKQIIVVWEHDDLLWLRYQDKDIEMKKIEQHLYQLSDTRLFDSASVSFAGLKDNQATVCKIGDLLFSRIFPPQDIIPVLAKGAIENTLQSNQVEAKKKTFQTVSLVAVNKLRPTIQSSLRLSSANNPLKKSLLSWKDSFLSSPAAEALAKVEESLQSQGLSLVIYQAYLPWYAEQTYLQLIQTMQIEKQEWNSYLENRFSTGCTVHVGLFNQKSQQFVDMGSDYLDEIEESNPEYFGGTSLQRYYKHLLRFEMKKNGFLPYSSNWWGYTFQTKESTGPINQDPQ